MEQIGLLIVDDHVVVRKGIEMIVNTIPSIQIVGEAEDGLSAVRQAASLQPDVILMDLVMPDGDGIDAIAEIKRDYPHIKIIVLTTYEDKLRINAAIDAGADGYLLKNADGKELLQAIQQVQQGAMPLNPRVARQLLKNDTAGRHVNGDIYLTPRELDVLQLVAQGLNNKEIGQTLHLSESTVKVYVSKILRKLNVVSRTEAAVKAMQLDLVPAADKQ